MEESCCFCGENISELNELDRLTHMDQCLDSELLKKSDEIENIDTQKYVKPVILQSSSEIEYDYTGMPDFQHMTANEIKKHLNDFGMKKTIDTKSARNILVEVWLYVNQGVFPKFLEKYL